MGAVHAWRCRGRAETGNHTKLKLEEEENLSHERSSHATLRLCGNLCGKRGMLETLEPRREERFPQMNRL